MNIIQFLHLVSEMRKAQKDYYRYKDAAALKKAIRYEMQVDKIIKEGKFFLPQERVTSLSNPIENN